MTAPAEPAAADGVHDARDRAQQAPGLELAGVTKHFGGVVAIDRVDLVVPRGEARALIGPNGAGKSTLLNLVTGEARPDTGGIRLFGTDLTRRPVQHRMRLGLGRTYQTSNLFAELTVRENLFLSAWRHAGGSRGVAALLRPWRRFPAVTDRVAEIAAAVGLSDRLEETVGELSHGDHRLLELGLALAHAPRILLLDEPLAGLSARERRFMTDRIAELKADHTLILIEHDVEMAFEVADRVTVLHHGAVVAEGPPAEIRQNAYVQEIYTMGRT